MFLITQSLSTESVQRVPISSHSINLCKSPDDNFWLSKPSVAGGDQLSNLPSSRYPLSPDSEEKKKKKKWVRERKIFQILRDSQQPIILAINLICKAADSTIMRTRAFVPQGQTCKKSQSAHSSNSHPRSHKQTTLIFM